jgi:hypothetical protein
MTVSSEMANQIGNTDYEAYKDTAQAVVNAAWTDLNPEDKSTWPKQGKRYFLYCVWKRDNKVNRLAHTIWSDWKFKQSRIVGSVWEIKCYALASTLMKKKEV